jgi:histidyl-tRNA synthetase
VERNKDKIKELIKIAEELRKALLNIDFDSKEKQRLSEKQQKQEKTLSFLHST